MNKLLLALPLLLWGSSAAAAESLSKREQALAQGNARIYEVNELHGRYRRLRDTYLNGPEGLIATRKAFHEGAAAWIAQWQKILKVTDLVDDLSIANAIQLGARVQKLFAEQREAYAKLQLQAGLIDIRGTTVQKEADMIASSPLERYPTDERAYVKKLQASVAEYREGASRSVTHAYQRIGDLDGLFEPTRAAFEAKLSAALIASGRLPLQASLAQARASLKADELSAPLVAGMRQRYELFRKARARELFFLAGSYADDADAFAANARQTIEAAGLNNALATEALNYIDGYKTRVTDEYAILTNQGEAKTVANGARKMTAYFKARCAAGDKTVNCERLRTMGLVSETQIAAMSTPERRAFENLWMQVGPIL